MVNAAMGKGGLLSFVRLPFLTIENVLLSVCYVRNGILNFRVALLLPYQVNLGMACYFKECSIQMIHNSSQNYTSITRNFKIKKF